MAAASGEPEVAVPAPPRVDPGAFLVALFSFLAPFDGWASECVLPTSFPTGSRADVLPAGVCLTSGLTSLVDARTLWPSSPRTSCALVNARRTQEAGRVAGAAFALLLAIAGAISLLGVLFAPFIVSVFTNFTGQRRELLIAVVRILFPMTGVLVLYRRAAGCASAAIAIGDVLRAPATTPCHGESPVSSRPSARHGQRAAASARRGSMQIPGFVDTGCSRCPTF